MGKRTDRTFHMRLPTGMPLTW